MSYPKRTCLHLYYAKNGNVGAHTRTLLAAGDLERLAGIMHPRRRAQYLTGRALLRFALQRWTGRPARSHRLRTAPGGKPECIDGPAISVSHSGDLTVCAISDAGHIGIDVQFPVPQRRIETIARDYFSSEENVWLQGQQSDRFYMLWVLKEAYLKAIGLGLAGGLDTLQCRIEPPVIQARLVNDTAAVHLALYSVGQAFLAVATTACPLTDVSVEFWNPDVAANARPSPIQLIARTT